MAVTITGEYLRQLFAISYCAQAPSGVHQWLLHDACRVVAYEEQVATSR